LLLVLSVTLEEAIDDCRSPWISGTPLVSEPGDECPPGGVSVVVGGRILLLVGSIATAALRLFGDQDIR